jgi:uncharacterized protein (TIGR02145 family)
LFNRPFIIPSQGFPQYQRTRMNTSTYTINRIALGLCIIFMSCNDNRPPSQPPSKNTVTDIDGNKYKFVKIGNQYWLTQNLMTTRYQDGSHVIGIVLNSEWMNLRKGAWCTYDNEPENGRLYGNIYNWFAVHDERGLCPKGWHVPSDSEWKELESQLGLSKSEVEDTGIRGSAINIGTSMKLKSEWTGTSNESFNESGFSAKPAGGRSANGGDFYGVHELAVWWSSTSSGAKFAWTRGISPDFSGIGRYASNKNDGFCVRCVKD